MRARVVTLAMSALAASVWHCGGATTPDTGDASTTAHDASMGGDDASPADSGACAPGCEAGRACCNGACVNVDNDPFNCGGCGTRCSGATPYCDGTCKAAPCSVTGCTGDSCCESQCCAAGQLCCKGDGPVGGPISCYTPTAAQPTCPQGCAPLCRSDRNVKRDVVAVDPREVLDAVGRGGVDSPRDPIDAHGATLTSIQALYEMLREQRARVDALEAERAKEPGRRIR
jgi:hypothetical protein